MRICNFCSNYAINGIIIESTIEDNSRGQVTFLFYATFNNGIIPRNVLSIIVEVTFLYTCSVSASIVFYKFLGTKELAY